MDSEFKRKFQLGLDLEAICSYYVHEKKISQE